MDPRASMALLGGAIGLVIVLVVAIVGPPVVPVVPTFPQTASPGIALPSIPPAMVVPEVYRRFSTLGSATSAGEAGELSVRRPGDLLLPSGRVVAADVFFFDTLPFSRALPVGRYPVFVLEVEGRTYGGIAAAMIRVAPGDPVRWEPAVTSGHDASSLRPEEFVGYGVDSGTGCFASAEAVEFLSRRDGNTGEAYAERVTALMFPSRTETHVTVDVPVGDPAGLNVIAFQSGFGDGGYLSYFGLDVSGRPLVLLTTFDILDAAG